MCGRFAFYSPHQAMVRLFNLPGAPEVEAHYNIAPTQYVPVVRHDESAARRLALLYWGLVPSWATEKSIGARMINARAETVSEKPSFRSAFKRRRCLVLADGYYEWQTQLQGKQPHFVRMRSGEAFAMAGLWETWRDGDGIEPLESCTIITTDANVELTHIQNRMPVILPPEQYDFWLGRNNDDAAALTRLLQPFPGSAMQAIPVSKRVNSARNDDADLVRSAAAKPEGK